MAAFLSWANENWFNLLQSLGIIGGLALTTASVRRDTRARKITDLLSVAANHRELWSDAHRRPELSRIFQKEVDLVSEPISVAETEFLNIVFVHFHTGWLLTKESSLITRDELIADLRSFLALPVPKAVWEETKSARDPAFIHFVDSCTVYGFHNLRAVSTRKRKRRCDELRQSPE